MESSGEEDGEEEMEQEMDEESQEHELDDPAEKKVRKHLAMIRVPYKGPNEPIVFSYHYKYEQYLRDNNLIDVS